MFVKLSEQLYPKARVWRLFQGSVYRSLHAALSLSEQEYYNNILSLQDSALPDNDNFTVEDAERWESALALGDNSDLTLVVRKEIILRKINFPGNIKPRQSALFLQRELQAAGFDVYIYENKLAGVPVTIMGAICGLITVGQTNVGQQPAETYDIIANEIEFEPDFVIAGNPALKFTFFIGGLSFLSRADVDSARKKQLIELILKIKPAQSIGLSLINWI